MGQVSQIVKFCGITSDQVAALDKVLKSNEVSPWVRRLKVVSEGESDGYLYEVAVVIIDIKAETRGDSDFGHERRTKTTRVSRKVMDKIYDALRAFPEKEEQTATEWK